MQSIICNHAVKMHIMMHDCIVIVLAANIHIYIYICRHEDFIKSFWGIFDRLLISLQWYKHEYLRFLGNVRNPCSFDIYLINVISLVCTHYKIQCIHHLNNDFFCSFFFSERKQQGK